MYEQQKSYNQALELHWQQRKITQLAHVQMLKFLYLNLELNLTC